MLRVIQLNVARFQGGLCEITKALKSMITNPKASIICLNEVDLRDPRSEALNEIANDCLSAPHVSFFGHVAKGMYGNAILSSFPMDEKVQVHLRGGSKVKLKERTKRIVRGFNCARLKLPNEKYVRIVSTHLDHMSEVERTTQIEHIVEIMNEFREDEMILTGDFNALCRKDYSESQWNALLDRARKNNWSMPTNCDALYRMCDDLQLQDAFSKVTSTDFTANVDTPMYRIDYIFSSRAGFTVDKSFVNQDIKVSDHFPVVADLSLLKTRASL